jgi:serralysin
VMTGGTGDDVFVFDNLAIGGIDKILDFDGTHDLLKFDDAVFTALAGGLSADNLVVGARASAQDSNDFLLFDTNKHQLLYDADGNGAETAVAIVTLAGVNTVHVDDFWVF